MEFLMILAITLSILVTAMYMWGGQLMKGVRRFGVPSTLFIYSQLKERKIDNVNRYRYLALLFLSFILSMGYGKNSWMYNKLFKQNDIVTRLFYGFLIALLLMLVKVSFIPFIVLPLAFVVRSGSFGTVFGKDLLIEDLIRGQAIFWSVYILI